MSLAGFPFAISADASTLWSSSAVPAIVDSGDPNAHELGVKFQSDTAGYITGIRFYKASANTGTHVGHLWTRTGTLLASATFTSETSSGWQQVTFATPVAIAANTTYVASYYGPNGHYSLNRPYFTSRYDNAPLHALADGTDGPNGVYFYPATGFPTYTYQQSNYWVDVVFNAGVSGSLWSSSTVPAIIDGGSGGYSLELGVRFRSDVAGYISGIRFYKASTNTGTHVGHLWTNTGTLLASATFTGETASGWQQATFAAPVSIAANTTYVASYLAPNGHFSLNRPYFSGTYNNAPLHALADGTDGPNGIYFYPGSGFPSSTYQQSNYWVDVVFINSGSGSGSGSTPTVWSISPGTGPTSGGTAVTINGTNFLSGASVSFGGAGSTAVTFISASQINALTPAGSAGTVAVTVTNPGGLSASLPSAFTYTTTSGSGGGGGTVGQGLLTGMAPSHFSVPAGWTLVTTQDFESGTLPGGQGLCSDGHGGTAFELGFGHGGSSRAVFRQITSDNTQACWFLNGNAINSRDVYYSWYEYSEAQGRLNVDNELSRRVLYVGGNPVTDININWQPGANSCYFNCVLGQTALFAEGTAGYPNFSNYGGVQNPKWGNWVQYELHVRANDPGLANGEIELFQDGVLIQQNTNKNFSGSLDMSVSNIEIGGVYTEQMHYTDGTYSTCSNTLTPWTVSFGNFSNGCPCPAECPPSGYVPIFKRYFDDIIVLKR